MSDSLNVGGLAELSRRGGELGVEQVRREQGVHKGRLAEARRAGDENVELEAALERLAVDLLRKAVKANLAAKGRLL